MNAGKGIMATEIEYAYQPFVQTKWLGQTDKRPARVKATNLTSGEYVVVSWEYGLDVVQNHLQAAQALYRKIGQDMPHAFIACGTKDSSGYILTAR